MDCTILGKPNRENDQEFLNLIEKDIELFIDEKPARRVLLFPPLDSYKRFLIHKLGEQLNVSTFSVGEGLLRLVVVAYPRGVASSAQVKTKVSAAPIMNTRDARKGAVSKSRRSKPDVALYVPPAIRNRSNVAKTSETKDTQKKSSARSTDNDKKVDTVPISTDLSRIEAPKAEELKWSPHNVLRITNIPPETTRTSLENMFSSRGIFLKSMKLTKSEAIVTFYNQTFADMAIDIFKDILFKGCNLKLEPYIPNDQSEKDSDNYYLQNECFSDANSSCDLSSSLNVPEIPNEKDNISPEIETLIDAQYASKHISEDEKDLLLQKEPEPDEINESSIKMDIDTSTDQIVEPIQMECDVRTDEINKPITQIESELSLEKIDEIKPELNLVKINEPSVQLEFDKLNGLSVKIEPDKIEEASLQLEHKPTDQIVKNLECVDVDVIKETGSEFSIPVKNIQSNLNNKSPKKDKASDSEELLRASEEINRRNKRIMKPTFTQNDILIISKNVCDEEESKGPDSWEDLFDENGELDNSILDEIVQKVGDVTVTKAQGNYADFLQNLSLENDMAHVLEVYDFPPQFETRDLVTILNTVKCGPYHIKWVDDNHALGVFSSGFAAAQILSLKHPMLKLRPLSEASKQSMIKAKKYPKAMEPFMERPQTCPQTARRMVTGALGVKLTNAREERQKEIKILKEAREKKKLAIQQELDAWEGKPSK